MLQKDALTRRKRSSRARSAIPIGAPSKSSRKIASPGASSAGRLNSDSVGEPDGFMQSDDGEAIHVWKGIIRALFSKPRSRAGQAAPASAYEGKIGCLGAVERQAVRLLCGDCRALIPFAS